MSSPPLTFDQLLELLGYLQGEFVAVCHRAPGGPFTGQVTAYPLTGADLARVGELDAAGADLWFGVNPVVGPAGRGGRGTAEQVTRLAAVWADLDVKPGGFTDFDHATAVIDDLAVAVGTDPVAVVNSGHGLQPYWSLDPLSMSNPLSQVTRPDVIALLRRWGRLVHHFAELRGAAVDSVFDLPRVLRIPFTHNHKPAP